MRKFLVIALLFIASALAFGQDGRTKVNFYNQTSSTLRFMLNGNPACTGDVIPGGFCTESVNPGSYTASATDGQQTTGGQSFDIAYGETYNYRVYVKETAANVAPGLKLVSNLDYHTGFTVNAPVELKTDGPKQSTSNAGKTFTETLYAASLENDDTYMVGVSEYAFQVAYEDLDRGIEGFRSSVNGTVTKTETLTVSGNQAKMAVVESVVKGRTMRFGLLITYHSNKAYMFCFGTWLDSAGTNMDDVKTFFSSARIQ